MAETCGKDPSNHSESLDPQDSSYSEMLLELYRHVYPISGFITQHFSLEFLIENTQNISRPVSEVVNFV